MTKRSEVYWEAISQLDSFESYARDGAPDVALSYLYEALRITDELLVGEEQELARGRCESAFADHFRR